MNQQGLLADKKRGGRYSGDYFLFNVCEIHFSGFIEVLDSKGMFCTLKKVLRLGFRVRVRVITSATQRADAAGFTLAT